MLLRRLLFFVCTALLLATGITRLSSYAQAGTNSTCPSLVQQAIAAMGSNCQGLSRNSACYGTFRVNATFTDAQAQAAFSAPAARASIDTLQTIRTAPMNLQTNEWGVAVINAQANLPGVLPGQNAVFLLIGDAEVENAVPQSEAFQSAEPHRLRTQVGANLYEAPGISAEIVDEIPAGAEILTDAVSEDGAWLRTAYGNLGGWVSRQVVAAEEDLSDLPTYTEMSRTPMQAFYFRTNIGTECTQAPDAVVVQGPRNLTIDIQANGADIRLGSTVLFRTLPLDSTAQQLLSQQTIPENVNSLFQIIVLDGTAILYPDSAHPIYVPAGYTTAACLSNPQNLGIDGQINDSIVLADCGFSRPRPLSPDEWNALTALNGITLTYPINITRFLGETCEPNPDWVYSYLVRAGDSLSRIAALYNTTADALAQGNCLDNPDLLYVGEVLRVPSNQPPPPSQDQGQPAQPPPPSSGGDATPIPPTAVPTTPAPGVPTVTPTFTFTPTNTPIPCPIPPVITAGDAAGLITAITNANDEVLCPGADTINLQTGSYVLTATNNITDGSNGLPSIMTAIIINGNGATIDRMSGDFFRLFHVSTSGNLTLNTLTVQGGNPGTGENGGGIFNAGTLTLNGVTANSNSSDANGGAIYTVGNLNLVNSTISGNSAINGTGIAIQGGSATIQFTTMWSNDPPMIGGSALAFLGGTATVKNIIVGQTFNASNCGGTATSVQGVNFDTDGSCGPGFTNAFIGLTPLQNNGGSTNTHMPISGSQNIDAATDCTLVDGTPLGSDQRGSGRPTDDNADSIPVCESGSVEGALSGT